MGIHPLRVLRGPVAGWLIPDEVGDVVAHPARSLGIPPDVGLPLRPRAALRIGGAAVVHDPAVQWPGKPPTEMCAGVAGRIGQPVPGKVALVRVDAAVDPAATGRAAVILQLGTVFNLLPASPAAGPVVPV